MIKTRITLRSKSGGSISSTTSGGFKTTASSSGGGSVSEAAHAAEADHALTADEATHAGETDHALTADEANHATAADEAAHAASAYELDPDSPTRDDFLSRKNADTAEGHITFLEGLSVGNFKEGDSGARFDKQGNGELESLKIRS